eukprot:TRINITY_DN6231_c0_g1_i1.p1 TRINITY_DN6231_c0_g1~~TRINITY_DN6231_c0_g1_i1.p1  ORF type:complete len:425 (+),score=88.10 TRINITY_DN6231_c0_g1_i1:1515-2789(+)
MGNSQPQKQLTPEDVLASIISKEYSSEQFLAIFAQAPDIVPSCLSCAVNFNNSDACAAALKSLRVAVAGDDAASLYTIALDKDFPRICHALGASQRCLLTVETLIRAITMGRYECAVELLETNKWLAQALSSSGDSALHLAYAISDTRMIRQLVSNGALIDAPNAMGLTPLITCSLKNAKQHVAVLLELGASATLHQLCYASGVEQAIPRLEQILRGLDRSAINAFDASGRAAILYCPRTLTIGFLQRMLAAGADPNAVDPAGDTLLHRLSIPRKNIPYDPRTEPLVELLLKSGANPNKQNASGRTPLHVALDCALTTREGIDPFEAYKIVQLLMRHGADVNMLSATGTPLELWVFAGGWVLSDPVFSKSSLVQELVVNHQASLMSMYGGSLLDRAQREDVSLHPEGLECLRSLTRRASLMPAT